MARKNDSPQKATMREMMRDYLKQNDISIKSGTDVNSVMRDEYSAATKSQFRQGGNHLRFATLLA